MMRVVVASAVVVIGLVVIYAFGAGYLSGVGVGLPTPWNVLASLGLLLLLVWAAVRIAERPAPKDQR